MSGYVMPEQDNVTVTDEDETVSTAVATRDREAVATVDDDGAIVIPTHIEGLPLVFAKDQRILNADQMRVLGPLGIEATYDLGEVIAFLIECRKRGFDPYAKEAMLYQIAGKYIRHIGIEGLRRKAEESQKYRGQAPPLFCGPDGMWRDIWTGSEPPLACKVGVYRAGFVEAVARPTFWDEYCPMGDEKQQDKTGRWIKTGRKVPLANWRPAKNGGKPLVMLVKCAEAAALRAAWPNRFNGWYIPEETAKMRADAADEQAEAGESAEQQAARQRRRAAYAKASPPKTGSRVIEGEATEVIEEPDQGRRAEMARQELAWQAQTLGKDLEWITRRWRASRGGQDFATATAAEVAEQVIRWRPVVVDALRKAGREAHAVAYAGAGDVIAPLAVLLGEEVTTGADE